MAPIPRTKDRHLPPRVYIKCGAYYYVDINRKWHKLGYDFPHAMAAWSKLVNSPERVVTMNNLFDRYMVEVAPLKKPRTYRGNQYEVRMLRAFFGDMSPGDITPVHIYGYLDKRGKAAPVRANREKALLSHCFTKAIEWGEAGENPCKLVKRKTERPRKRYIEDWEFLAIKKVSSPLIQSLMEFAYITGQRIGDILKIKMADITEQGILIEQNKTGAKLIIEWSDELRACVNTAKALPRPIRGLNLFCTRRGMPYGYEGFASIWQRTIKAAHEADVIHERFTFHDIRAKSRSDAEDGANASRLLGHTDERITERVYNRKAKRVRPIK